MTGVRGVAIAPLPEFDGYGDAGGDVGMPWPRPALRPVAAAPRARAGCRPVRVRPAEACRRREVGAARRRLHVRRWRAVLLGALLAALVTGLSLPSSVLGGAPAAPPRALAAQGARVAGSVVYVVKPGDTLWSIAARFDRGGDPRPMAEALARETGSAAVVPGERIVVP